MIFWIDAGFGNKGSQKCLNEEREMGDLVKTPEYMWNNGAVNKMNNEKRFELCRGQDKLCYQTFIAWVYPFAGIFIFLCKSIEMKSGVNQATTFKHFN